MVSKKKNYTKYLVILFIAIILVLAIIFIENQRRRVLEISTFEECKETGYVIISGFPRYCTTPDGRTFVEPTPVPVICTPESREFEICITLYDPVCGYDFSGEKIKTYSNSCYACSTSEVQFYTEGEC